MTCNDLRGDRPHPPGARAAAPGTQEQTHQSIRRNFLEEAYEAAEAIDEESPEHLKEELGDVLLQVVLHARMEQEAGRFDLDDVADGICKKLIYRHPHVFGDVSVSGPPARSCPTGRSSSGRKRARPANADARGRGGPYSARPVAGGKGSEEGRQRRALTGPDVQARWTSSPRRSTS